jgi:hypothetical protein
MEKLKTLTKHEFNRIENANNIILVFKRMLGLTGEYFLGDTFATIDNAEMLGVYKHNDGVRDYYYLVVNTYNNNKVFTWCLWQHNN